MDRIDSYIQQAFTKFQDVSEIQAQKEEMADHLRDRIADAIGQGKSEKDAFASATAAMSDAMPDLEQTLAEFLRPEFKHGVKQQPKPNTKEIYINFYRYHRAMMLMFVPALFTLMMILLSDFSVRQMQWEMRWKWIDNLMGITAYFNFFVGIFVVFSIVAYILKPRHVKRVSVSPKTLLIKYGIGVFLITTIALVQWYATIFPEASDETFRLVLYFLLYYSVFFIVFCWLGWFRQHRYMKAPDFTQDTSLAKWGLLLSAVFLTINLFALLAYMNMVGLNIRQEYEHGGPYNSVVMYNNQLQQEIEEIRKRNQVSRDELNALHDDELYKPRNAVIVGDPMDYSPMTSLHPPVIDLNHRDNSVILRDGTAAGVYDSRRHAINQQLWTVPGLKGDYKIIDTGFRFLPDMPGGSSSMGMSGMMMGPGDMMGGSMGGMSMGAGSGMMSGGMGSFEPPERKEHTLTLDGEFPASDLAENVICARQFPFEEYKLGMIQAVVPETVADGETFPLRLGVGNLDARNAKLLLTVEYDDGLQQNDIPSGATLFLGFIGSHEYREYKTEFTLRADSTPTDGKYSIRLTLRNESGLVIAETKVMVTCESS